MAWFRRKPEETAGKPPKVNIAEGLWIKCDSCKEIVYRAEVERGGRVCPKCRYPFPIGSRERHRVLAGAGPLPGRPTRGTPGEPPQLQDSKRHPHRAGAAHPENPLEGAGVPRGGPRRGHSA